MNLTIAELLDYTDEERAKWQAWFAAQGNDPLKIALSNETHSSIGVLIMHIFWAELWYAYWMRGEPFTPEGEIVKQHKDTPNDQAEAIFRFGQLARASMRSFTDAAQPEDWERGYELKVMGFHMLGPVRKLIAHILIHEIRHWAQVALAVRQHGLAPPGNHDLLFSESFGPLARRV
jgi:uncharacterized damage-inducible protein DinB